jgi:KaiC/GvpD/RAD55 family RecA-like ATPase
MTFFDYLLKRNNILVIGSSRSGKGLLAEEFVVDGIKKGEKSLYIMTNNFPEDFMKDITGIGNFHIENKSIKIVDCYTNFVGVPRQDSEVCYRVSSPTALNEISIAVNKSLKESPKRVVFDSASTIILHNSIGEVERFFRVMTGRLKSYSSTLLILLEEGVHDPKDIAVMESLTSLTVRFKEKNGEKYMEMSTMSGIKTVGYKIENNRMEIKELLKA